MLEQKVTIHGKHQLEMKLAYELDHFEKARQYDVSLYLFFPVSLNITSTTYEKRDFFNDYMSYIRIKTPSYLLQNIATGANNPLSKLETTMKEMTPKPTGENTDVFERSLKMFCCILRSALRDHIATLETRTNEADQRDIVEQFVVNTREILKQFRKLRPIMNVPTINKKLFSQYLFADEYISLIVENSIYKMLETLKIKHNDSFEPFKNKLLKIAHKENAYRKDSGYPSIADTNCDNETLLFRKSVLKKYFENTLFLSIRTKPEGILTEQFAFAIAAGLSMVFATAIAFFFQRAYGNLTLPFFVALVVSYMFKDRLKELTRITLGSMLKKYSFDRKLSIFDNGDGGRDKRIGICRERFKFLNEKDVPDDIWRIRSRDHITEIENGWVGETIINYHKHIQLFPGWFKKAHEDYSVEGINDILRLNMSKFFLRMDDPIKTFWMCDDSDYYQSSGDRVYHINAIVQYKSDDSTEKKRFRIVANKEGIKRIEHVSVELF